MAEKKVIETGVDRLLSVIKSKEKISIKDAAREFGVSEAIIEEWGDFLEDSGYISKEFKFTKTYLVIKTVSSENIINKAEQISRKKESVVNKAEVTLASLDKDEKVILSLKGEFEKLKKNLTKELGEMKVEFGQLERYELLKGDIDKKLLDQEKKFKEKISVFDSKIEKEEDKFQKILEKVKNEELVLEKKKEDGLKIRETEHALMDKAKVLIRNMEVLKLHIEEDDKTVKKTEKSIENLTYLSKELENDVKKKKDVVSLLIKENKEYENQILIAQKEIASSISKEKGKISKKKNPEDQFKIFFSKKNEIGDLITKVEHEKELLEKELIQFIKKAKTFRVSKKSVDAAKTIKEIEEKFKKVSQRQSVYEELMKKLNKLVGLKERKSKLIRF